MALLGIDPVLGGDLLAFLDAMGHSDAVVVADAHFPAQRLGRRCVDVRGVPTPRMARAVRSVIPPDSAPAVALMATPDGVLNEVQRALLAAIGATPDEADLLARQDFYAAATTAFVIVRTGEARPYGNLLLRKGTFPLHDSREVPR